MIKCQPLLKAWMKTCITEVRNTIDIVCELPRSSRSILFMAAVGIARKRPFMKLLSELIAPDGITTYRSQQLLG